MFSKSFVINLPFKTDRLKVFQANAPSCLGAIDVWPAVHGDSVRHPDCWTAGPGAWGCYRSHLQILEHCYQNGIESYIVFEDDAIFRTGFEERLAAFMAELPNDWQQVYLGGQLYHESTHPPKKVSEHVYVPFNVNRTHCFAVHRRGYEALYRHWMNLPFAKEEHLDHHIGRLHESGGLKIYVPNQWLVGQDSGPSNISGKNNGAMFWVDAEKYAPENRKWQGKPAIAVFLESTIAVAIELERRGWHRGHWQNAERLDHGVCNALGSLDVKAGLTAWYKSVTPEAVRQGNPCVCLFHPNLTWACVSSWCASLPTTHPVFHRIQAETADDAELQLEALQNGTQKTATRIRRRNLIYHIWPRKSPQAIPRELPIHETIETERRFKRSVSQQGNGVWQWNVQQLLQRIDQFDGVRSIGIVTSPDADSVEDVQKMFAGVRIDNWIINTNNPELGEVVSFANLLNTVPKDESVTFYGHAKGVSYDNPKQTREWTSMCYEVCLDDPQYVDASLEQYPVTGPFINTQGWQEIKHGWHFSGSFYWFRNADVFARPEWAQIQQFRWGTETWPGNLFTRHEAGSLFGQECHRLYDAHELSRMQSWLQEWRKQRRPMTPKIEVV